MRGMKNKLMMVLFVMFVGCCVLGLYLWLGVRADAPLIDEDASLLVNETVAETDKTEEQQQENADEVANDLAWIVNTSMQDNGIDVSQVGIVVHDFVTDAVYAVNADSYFTAGSTYKLPLAMRYYEMIAAGEIDLSDTLYYDPSYYEEGGPISVNYMPGAMISVEELLHCMIVDSDNTAAHILYEHLDGWLGFKDAIACYSCTPVDETDAVYYSYENMFTANYMNDVLNTLYTNKEMYTTLIDDLTTAKPDDYLNGVIGGTKMAQKYGQYEMAENALGFSTSGRPYSIVVYTSLGYFGREWMGTLNALIWDYFASLAPEKGADN